MLVYMIIVFLCVSNLISHLHSFAELGCFAMLLFRTWAHMNDIDLRLYIDHTSILGGLLPVWLVCYGWDLTSFPICISGLWPAQTKATCPTRPSTCAWSQWMRDGATGDRTGQQPFGAAGIYSAYCKMEAHNAAWLCMILETSSWFSKQSEQLAVATPLAAYPCRCFRVATGTSYHSGSQSDNADGRSYQNWTRFNLDKQTHHI